MLLTKFEKTVFQLINRMRLQKIPLGRWAIIHPNSEYTKVIMDRKIDLANHDSCYCESITECIQPYNSGHLISQSSNKK